MRGGSRFDLLQMIDDLEHRPIDSSDFFAMPHPSKPSDAEMYQLPLKAYPGWRRMAWVNALLSA